MSGFMILIYSFITVLETTVSIRTLADAVASRAPFLANQSIIEVNLSANGVKIFQRVTWGQVLSLFTVRRFNVFS
jgi:hypothetical protein